MKQVYIVVGENEFFAGTYAYESKARAKELATEWTEKEEDTKYHVQELHISYNSPKAS